MNTTFVKTYSTVCDRLNDELSLLGNLRTFVHSFIDDNALVIIIDRKGISPGDRNALCALAIELEKKLNTVRCVLSTSETNELWRIQNDEVCVTFDFENAR